VRGLTEEKQKAEAGFFDSKYWKMLLILIMGVLLFGAPYAAYAFISIVKLRFLYSTVLAFGAMVLGLLLMWYLVRKKVIS
jgi:phosphoglycerol transferase MdoB-like AlkP superfamily enzyme